MTEFTTPQPAGEPLRSIAADRAATTHPEALDDIALALSGRVTDSQNLVALMAQASRTAVRHLPGVDWAAVTTRFGGTPSTPSHTDARVLEFDDGRYDAHDGPCLRAMRSDSITSMDASEVAAAWPELGRAAQAAGVRSFLAAPLHARLVSVGSINMYSGGLDLHDAEPDLLRVIVDYLDRGLDDYLDCRSEHGSRIPRHAVAGWGRIEQAVGVMMSVYGFSPDYAYAVLKDNAESAGVNLVDEADRVIASMLARPPR